MRSIAGQYLQTQEHSLYDHAVFHLFGFNAVQMGCLQMDLLSNSRMPNRYKLADAMDNSAGAHFSGQQFDYDVAGSDDFLPFAEMSLDLLLLPHRLEFSPRPHQTLREASRVMMPDGHLLISGFNPHSAWGLTSALKKILFKQASYPWHGNFIALPRLKDWLTLLGFEVVSVTMCGHIPPFEQAAWHQRFAFMDKISERCCTKLGGVYFIVAKKRVVGMTPIKPNWKTPLKSSLIAVQPKTKPSQSKPAQSEILK